jgi:hypothetical protein
VAFGVVVRRLPEERGRPRSLRRARGVGVVLLALLTRLHLGLALLTVAGLTLAGTAAPASAALPSGNLLQNPGAEGGPGAATAADTVAPPSWLTTPNFTAVQYTAPGSPDATVVAQIGGGLNYFAGGQNTAVSTATQVVDVSVAAPEIDAGGARATLSGYLGGFAGQEDFATVDALFLDARGGQLGKLTIGPVTTAQRGGLTTLLPRATEGAVPAATRSVRVVMTSTRQSGSYDDGYLDNLGLVLSRLGPPVLGRSVNVAAVSGRVFVRLPAGASGRAASATQAAKGTAFVPLTQPRQIPVGSLLDTRRGVMRLTSAANAGAAVQSGDFTAGVFQVLQSRRLRGLTDLNLTGGSFRGCAARGRRAAATRLSSRVVRRLRGSGRGRFRTRGRYSAATVRGTIWDTVDRCDGTLTVVRRGVVVVRDLRKRRNITVRAGKSYLARAPG